MAGKHFISMQRTYYFSSPLLFMLRSITYFDEIDII